MISTYPLFNKLINFLFPNLQADPLAKAITSIFNKKQANFIIPELDQSINLVKNSSKSEPKDSSITSESAKLTQPSYTINNKFLDNFEKSDDTEIFLICLNRPFDLDVLASLHEISSYTIMADGAANLFHDRYNESSKYEFLPHALVGDFDSIRDDIMQYYKAKEVGVFHDESQDDSDLEKCLKHLQRKITEEKLYTPSKYFRVIITGGFGGRMDHTLNNIHIIHKFAEEHKEFENLSFHLIDNDSIGTCILPGKTRYIRAEKFEKSAGCGMFPLMGMEAKVQTKGLKWNVGPDFPMSFKKFVSSSNEMVEEVVEFETDQIIFWVTTNVIHGKCSDK
jgi:thiamine pyrophosphokinase